jgi:hypothetical protein
MFQKRHCTKTESRSRAGPINVRRLACTSVIIAAGLGLTACIGPYDDGYGQVRIQSQSNPKYYDDNGYQQRRNATYRQYPYTSQDQRRNNHNWWRGADYSYDRNSHER